VKVNGLHPGFSYGTDGITHHEVNDISVVRGYPSFEIYAPCDHVECALMTEYAIGHRGPVYMSLNTGVFPAILPKNHRFVPGKPIQWAEGADITIIALGTAIHDALDAAARMRHVCGTDVFALSSVRPLNAGPLAESMAKTGKVITVEQHSTHGGCGSLAAELIAERGLGARLIRRGVPEGAFTKNASAAANKRAFGLDAPGITEAIKRILAA
jgi:transketolase